MNKICAKMAKNDDGISGTIRLGAMSHLQPNFKITVEIIIAQ